jgi:hypothetical protein
MKMSNGGIMANQPRIKPHEPVYVYLDLGLLSILHFRLSAFGIVIIIL